MHASSPGPDDRQDLDALRAALAESQARLGEARSELARLVRLAEADFRRLRPGETSNVVASAVRRPPSKDVSTRIARFIELYRETAAAAADRSPVVPEPVLQRWLEESGLFDRQYYLRCNDDVEGSGTDPMHHYYHHGLDEARHPSPL